MRRGEMLPITMWQSKRLVGSDFCGLVEEVGEAVTHYSVGDRVYGMVNQIHTGTSVDRISVSTRNLCHSPKNLTSEVAACVPLAALTALQALRDLAKVQKGCRVLVNGASGGVGSFAVQIATHFGALVTAVTSERNVDWMPGLGALSTLDYGKVDFTKYREAFDVVFDCYGNRSFKKCRGCMSPNGIYITTIPAFRHAWQQSLNVFRRQKSKVVVVRSRDEDLLYLKGLIENGHLKPVLQRSYARSEIRQAYKHLESKRTKGKLTVQWKEAL
jgi:NADPH:quinone reductase-like Zn-dependent oxidoreductase